MDVWTGPDISSCPKFGLQTGTVVRDFSPKLDDSVLGPIFCTGPRCFSPYYQEIDLTNHGPTNILDHRSYQKRLAKIFNSPIDHGPDYYGFCPWNSVLLF